MVDMRGEPRTIPQSSLSLTNLYVEVPPGYELVRKIGRGSFGQCWLAKHIITGCQVAVKVIPRTENMKLLEREISIWKSLDHPNVVKLYEVIPLHDNVYLATEYAGEGEVFRLLSKHPNGLGEGEALKIFCQLCKAVAYIHKVKIAHRDIKLENIFMTSDGVVKLGDFGFSTRVKEERKKIEEWMGSPEYAAPELLKNEPYAPMKADSWSLGVVLFALLTGYLPFSKIEDDTAKATEVDKRVRSRVINGQLDIPQSIGENLRSIIEGLLTFDPEKRWTVQQTLDNFYIQKFFSSSSSSSNTTLLGGGTTVGNVRIPPTTNQGVRILRAVSVAELPGVLSKLEGGCNSNSPSNPDQASALCSIIMRNPERFNIVQSSEQSPFSSPEFTDNTNSDLKSIKGGGGGGGIIASGAAPRETQESSSSWYQRLTFLPWAGGGGGGNYKNLAGTTTDTMGNNGSSVSLSSRSDTDNSITM